MNVIAITLLISLLLAGIFIICFATEAFRKNNSSSEQTSLLPLEDETPQP